MTPDPMKANDRWLGAFGLLMGAQALKNMFWSSSPAAETPVDMAEKGGVFSGVTSALGHIWSNLSYVTQWTVGATGVLSLAWLVNKYWKGSGNTVNNNITNKNEFHFSLNVEPGMKVIKEEKDGKVIFTVKSLAKEKLNQAASAA